MPTPTYVAIAKQVLTGTQASVTFSAIPSTYTDLLLVASARSSNNGNVFGQLIIAPNNGSFSFTEVYGSGSAATPWRSTNGSGYGAAGSTATANTFGNHEIYIPNYAGSTYKPLGNTGVGETNATAAFMSINAGLYSSTTAISSLVITIDAGSIASGSRFDLYGIKNS